MKTFTWTKWLILFASLCLTPRLDAQGIPPDTTNLLTSWSFWDTNAWHSDWDYAPISYTNLTASTLGDGTALVLNTTNFACLRYNVTESTGTNNIKVDVGALNFWFSPSWSGSNQGGFGPGQWGRLVEAGTYTSDASYGWWSLYLDPAGTNIYFSVQTNNGNGSTYLSSPVAWTNNAWHMVTLSYSSSNSSIFLDGVLATNGSGVAYWPGPNVLTNGFCIGSDSSGIAQAHGTFDDFATYNSPLSAGTVSNIYQSSWLYYYLNPLNWINITSAPSTNTVTPVFDAVTGQGYLTQGTNLASCVTNNNIWITNVTATRATNGNVTVTFSIAGGTGSVLYDVFANSILASSSDTNHPWSWMGQAYHCIYYSLTISNQPNVSAYLILGTPQDSDSDGLTDAYELLVSKTRPDKWDTDGDGMSDGWEVQFGTNPLVDETSQTSSRLNYGYDSVGRLKQVSGRRGETVTFDPEANIKTDSN
jgi:hypothetical protein